MWELIAGLEACTIGILLLSTADLKEKIVNYLDRKIRERLKDERAGIGDHVIDEPEYYDRDPQDEDDTAQFWAGV